MKIVGILNLTPDSFSDGGIFYSKKNAIERVKQMLQDGADLVDIGAESTRPNAIALSWQEEWKRLEPILPEIIYTIHKFNRENNKNAKSSIDTYHFETAVKSYECGVNIINDVSGLKDRNMINFIAEKNIQTILMHSLSIPANKNIVINQNENVVAKIIEEMQIKIKHLLEQGVRRSQLIFDVGIGFGKTSHQSIRIIKYIKEFRVLGLPIYVGHSRKSFLDELKIKDFAICKKDRDKKTFLISAYLSSQNIDFIRVHDVLENKKYSENVNLNYAIF